MPCNNAALFPCYSKADCLARARCTQRLPCDPRHPHDAQPSDSSGNLRPLRYTGRCGDAHDRAPLEGTGTRALIRLRRAHRRRRVQHPNTRPRVLQEHCHQKLAFNCAARGDLWRCAISFGGTCEKKVPIGPIGRPFHYTAVNAPERAKRVPSPYTHELERPERSTYRTFRYLFCGRSLQTKLHTAITVLCWLVTQRSCAPLHAQGHAGVVVYCSTNVACTILWPLMWTNWGLVALPLTSGGEVRLPRKPTAAWSTPNPEDPPVRTRRVVFNLKESSLVASHYGVTNVQQKISHVMWKLHPQTGHRC